MFISGETFIFSLTYYKNIICIFTIICSVYTWQAYTHRRKFE